MKTLVIYDIVDDKTRNKVMETCRDYGLEHIQYSAFFGELNNNLRQELFQRVRRILGRKEGKIMVCPMCDKDLRLLLEVAVAGEGAGNDAPGAMPGPGKRRKKPRRPGIDKEHGVIFV